MDRQVKVDQAKLTSNLQQARYKVLVGLRPVEPARAAYMLAVQAVIDTFKNVEGFDAQKFEVEVKLQVQL